TVEVSVQEAAINGLHPWAIPLADYARRYPILPLAPPRNADGAYQVIEVADGFVRVLPGSPRQWRGFVELLGNPDALAGPEWLIPIFRLANADVCRIIAREALRERTKADVIAAARRLDVPLVPVNTPEQFVTEEQTLHRVFFQRTGFQGLGDAPVAPGPLTPPAPAAQLRRPPPAPGGDDRPGFGARPPEPASGGAPGPPLAGVRVVDLGVGVAVPEAGWPLAELGAEVVKIESRVNLDFLRRVTIEPDQPDRSMQFNDSSRGHLSVTLDLRTERGRDLALRPDIIYYASQAFGRGGPLGEASAYGPLNSAFSGVT